MCAATRSSTWSRSLSRLVDHSLVRRLDDGRFLLLELMRERSRALLAEDPELDRDVRHRHASYLADWLDDLDERRWGEASGTWIEDITRLLADVRGRARVDGRER